MFVSMLYNKITLIDRYLCCRCPSTCAIPELLHWIYHSHYCTIYALTYSWEIVVLLYSKPFISLRQHLLLLYKAVGESFFRYFNKVCNQLVVLNSSTVMLYLFYSLKYILYIYRIVFRYFSKLYINNLPYLRLIRRAKVFSIKLENKARLCILTLSIS